MHVRGNGVVGVAVGSAGESGRRSSGGHVSVRVGAPTSYDAAVADLQRVLTEHGSDLDSATVRVLEANLATIDRAIGDARAALARDPANAYLNEHLAATMARKLELLRRAAAMAVAS